MDLSVLALEFVIILLLALFNGLLSMSEMALVSSRKLRLQQLAAQGHSGAKVALELLSEPSQFLASIQIGITLIGVLAGAFGGAQMADELNMILLSIPWLADYASALSLGSVVILVTLMSLILGELVPKRLALANSEAIAQLVAKPIRLLAQISSPAVRFLSVITEGILKIFRYKQAPDALVTDDEVRILIEQGAEAGVFEREEESIFKRTLKLSDKTVDEVMTKRLHLFALDINDSNETTFEKIRASNHSYFPVCQGSIDHIVGMVSIKQLFAVLSTGQTLDLKSLLQEPLFVAESMAALKLLEMFKISGKHFAAVIDEYGGLCGLVTAIDLLESLVGDLPEGDDKHSESIFQRQDGSWLVDGIISLEKINEVLDLGDKEFFTDDYQTLGGFLMGELGHIPHAGEKLFWKGWHFEVVDMDGHRVDKVLILPPHVQ